MSTEDLIFIVRNDRAKVNRLRNYLSWKDVRKNAKDPGGGSGGPGVELAPEDILEESAAAIEAEKSGAGIGKARKAVKLPWEVLNSFAECLNDESSGEEEDFEAHMESVQRLKVRST